MSQRAKKVPTYAPDGLTRLRNYSLKSVLAFESHGMMILKRHRKGAVQCAQFLESPPRKLKRPKDGTRYSHLEQVGCYYSWAHKQLPRISVTSTEGLTKRELSERIELLRRGAFAAVPLSIFLRNPDTQAPHPS